MSVALLYGAKSKRIKTNLVLCKKNKHNKNCLKTNLISACKKVTHWLAKKRLKPHCSKTDVIYFKGRPTQLKISGEEITNATHTKVLDIIIDQKLTFLQQKEMAKATLLKK